MLASNAGLDRRRQKRHALFRSIPDEPGAGKHEHESDHDQYAASRSQAAPLPIRSVPTQYFPLSLDCDPGLELRWDDPRCRRCLDDVALGASAQMVTLVQASITLPIVMLALVAGALADAFDRRILMLVAQIFMFAISTILAVCAYLDVITP